MAEKNTHEHDWRPDGESWTKTNHHPSRDYPGAETSKETFKALQNCECETHKLRRHTCHCGASKKVKLK